MKKIKNVRNYIALGFVLLWVVAVVYMVASEDGGFLRGQVYNAPKSCEEILADLDNPETSNVSALVDAAVAMDCGLPTELLEKLAPKLMEEQL
jgi:hypothetical protein